MKISATIITQNEEKNIADCLASLDFADEIIVVDSGSSDQTEAICRVNMKVKFYFHEWEGFGKQKNFAAERATNDWIFNIDADERVSPQLAMSIASADLDLFSCFRVARENYFSKRWVRRCGWYPDYNARLYDRKKCTFSERSVHESLLCNDVVGTLKGNLLHFTYEDVADYLRRMERYSTLAAKEVVKSGRKVGILHLLFKPGFTFMKMYFLKLGVFEGYLGVLLSIMYSHYTFYKYSKAKEMQPKSKK